VRGVVAGTISVHALLGILYIFEEPFLVVVTQVRDIGEIYQEGIDNVLEIKDAKLLAFNLEIEHNERFSEMKDIVSGVVEILKQGCYFSYHYDLTNSMQRSHKKVMDCSALFDRSNKQYVWNYPMSKRLVEASVSSNWLTPIIQGYVGIAEEEVNGKKLRLILISRRSYKHAGTRFNARGIDENGHAANTVETEQIVMYNGRAYSYVQLRGSVPVFWKQIGFRADVTLTKSPEVGYLAFTKHFDNLVKEYKKVMVFNLLSNKVCKEVILTNAYKDSIKIYEKKVDANVSYCHFDFHHERKIAVTYKS
jgi:phosphatidylinositol-bisphosphatase